MKKLLAIFLLISLITSAKSMELKNPGDVLVDFEKFSIEECASECKHTPNEFIFPRFPEEFS